MPTYQPATYKGRILDQGFGEASTGTPYFFVHVRIEAQYDDAGNTRACPNYEREARYYLGDSKGVGVSILRETLRGLGVDCDDLAHLELEMPDPISLVGREVEMQCEHEQYKGQTQERWRIARPRRQKLDLAAVRAMTARINTAPPSKPDDTPSIQAGSNPF